MGRAPTEQLRTQIDRVIKVSKIRRWRKSSHGRAPDGDSPRRQRHLRLQRDHASLARSPLARPHAQEREEVTRLYADLLERSYIGKIEMYSGEKIQFLGDTIDGDQATVRTRLVIKQGTDIPVDYRMHRLPGDRWLTYDVSIEGVSLVANYRAQFNKIIQTSGTRRWSRSWPRRSRRACRRTAS